MFAAVVLPSQVAYFAVPIPSLLTEVLAVLGFAALAMFRWRTPAAVPASPALRFWLAGTAILMGAALAQLAVGQVRLPSVVVQLWFFLACAAFVTWASYRAICSGCDPHLLDDWSRAWVIGCWLGLLVAAVQYLQLEVTPLLVSIPGTVGRISGNVRQSNHFATLMAMGVPCVAWLLLQGRMTRPAAVATLCAIGAVVVLTRSRTGALEVVVLALLCLLAPLRQRLVPVVALPALAVASLVFHALDAADILPLYGTSRTLSSAAENVAGDTRLQLWHDVWALVMQNPLRGIGFAQLNFYRLLSDQPSGLSVLHVNAHLLPLQLAAEFGLPVAIAFFALVSLALWKAFGGPITPSASFAALGMIALLIHSMTEFPLWYAYFLLPFALFAGVLLGESALPALQQSGSRMPRWPQAKVQLYAAIAMAAGTLVAVTHYLPTIAVYVLEADKDTLDDREATARRAFLFAHWIRYNGLNGLSFDSIATHPGLLPLFDTVTRFYMNDYNLAQYALSLAANGKKEHAHRAVSTLKRLDSKMLPKLEAYCAAANNAACATVREVVADPRPPTVSARDF